MAGQSVVQVHRTEFHRDRLCAVRRQEEQNNARNIKKKSH